jgi:hypothetical protein
VAERPRWGTHALQCVWAALREVDAQEWVEAGARDSGDVATPEVVGWRITIISATKVDSIWALRREAAGKAMNCTYIRFIHSDSAKDIRRLGGYSWAWTVTGKSKMDEARPVR